MSNNGKLIGYIRVSTLEQNPERQLEGIKQALLQIGCYGDKLVNID